MKPISVGDLVMVVRPLECGCTHAIGYPFTVLAITRSDATCTECLKYHENILLARLDDEGWLDVSALQRIDPLKEQEPVREEITA